MPGLRRILEVLRLPVRSQIRIGRERIREDWRRVARPLRARRDGRVTPEAILGTAWGRKVVMMLLEGDEPFASGFFFRSSELGRVLERSERQDPAWAGTVIRRAEEVLRGRTRILGESYEVGNRPDWQRDYGSNRRWPLEQSWRLERININDDSDIKFPWELSRLHQTVVLGQAHALTGETRYAQEAAGLIVDWWKKNPVYLGANWMCAMEVAIRLMNLAWTWFLIRRSGAATRELAACVVAHVLVHGRFIRDNLEYRERRIGDEILPINGNHYMSNLVGLLYFSVLFPGVPESRSCREFAVEQFHQEVLWQVNEEGVDWEYCTNYHRLVLELVVHGIRILQIGGIRVPGDLVDRVARMAGFIQAYTRPDGTAPAIRDSDNGRVVILGDEALDQHDGMKAVAEVLTGRRSWVGAGAPVDAFWLLGPGLDSSPVSEPLRAPKSTAYPKSGFYFMRSGGDYLSFLAAPVGMLGHCGHTHNDFLSFELCSQGATFVVDTGSIVYSRNPGLRNRMRSARSHNLVQVNGLEINSFPSERLFSIEAEVHPEVQRWKSGELFDLVRGSYVLPAGGGARVRVSREVYFNKEGQYWIISDELEGAEPVSAVSRLHFAPGVQLRVDGRSTLLAEHPSGRRLKVIPISGDDWGVEIARGLAGSVYGRQENIDVGVLSREAVLPCSLVLLILGGVWSQAKPGRACASNADCLERNPELALASWQRDRGT